MKGIIVYKGKYGATEQYAEWAASETKLPVFISHECSKEDIVASDFLVLGSSVYMGVLVIKEWIKENLKSLAGKKIFLFVVCGIAMDIAIQLENYIQASVPQEIREHCTVYFLPGKLNYKKLSWSDKFLIRIGSIFSGSTGGNKTMLNDFDAVKKENIIPMLQDIKLLINSSSLIPAA
ncbi:MAG: flavodoxin domain-containing protein [Bacteroidota bacterium]